MAPVIAVNPQNVRSGANAIDAAKTAVAGLHSPDTAAAGSGLASFETAGALDGVKEAVADSLKVVGGRYEEMAGLIRRAVDAFVLVASALDPPTQQAALTAMVGKSMTAMGDMNSAT